MRFLLVKTLGSRLLTLLGALLISIAIKDLIHMPAGEVLVFETSKTLTASLGLWLLYKGLGGHQTSIMARHTV